MQLDIKKQLALAVTSIQWSYSIFWSLSPSDPGVLEWGEGYYNGDIKTRKTVDGIDQMSLRRSDQLRVLYESLLSGESRRPSPAALVPEDLSDSEWYYLVCMSFVFNLGQGLPGRALEYGRPIWLCNAHRVDTRVFGRSLLAKSASIKTVVCFPFLGGVVELGTTDMVLEDHSLIQSVESCLLLGSDCRALAQEITRGEELRLLGSPQDNIFGMMEQVDMNESEFIMDEGGGDELSNCVDQPLEDLHYHNILGKIFGTMSGSKWEPSPSSSKRGSCFMSWQKGVMCSYHKPRYETPQRMLKKVLFGSPHMQTPSESANRLVDKPCQAEDDAITSSLVLVNESFCALKSLVPSIDRKVDDVTILDDTIKYMKELETRIKELESYQESEECCVRKASSRPQDEAERTSDNYRSLDKVGVKRKASDGSLSGVSTHTDLSISVMERDVLIEMLCPWRECLLLEILDTLTDARLDTHAVQSSISDGFQSLTIKAKIRGLAVLSAGTIRQVLQRVVPIK